MSAALKVAFAGTPEFAREALQAILKAGFEVPLVLTQPDRPAGRGMKLQASPVKQLALEHGIEIFQPLTLKDGEAQAKISRIADSSTTSGFGLSPALANIIIDGTCNTTTPPVTSSS